MASTEAQVSKADLEETSMIDMALSSKRLDVVALAATAVPQFDSGISIERRIQSNPRCSHADTVACRHENGAD